MRSTQGCRILSAFQDGLPASTIQELQKLTGEASLQLERFGQIRAGPDLGSEVGKFIEELRGEGRQVHGHHFRRESVSVEGVHPGEAEEWSALVHVRVPRPFAAKDG